jgi:hypothetical protein
MDFHEAVVAHTRWKIRLRLLIEGTGEALDPDVVVRDDRCDLGKWIYAEGPRLARGASYQELRTSHADFHKVAADVVRTSQAGDRETAAAQLEPGARFDRASLATVSAILKLKKETEAEAMGAGS